MARKSVPDKFGLDYLVKSRGAPQPEPPDVRQTSSAVPSGGGGAAADFAKGVDRFLVLKFLSAVHELDTGQGVELRDLSGKTNMDATVLVPLAKHSEAMGFSRIVQSDPFGNHVVALTEETTAAFESGDAMRIIDEIEERSRTQS